MSKMDGDKKEYDHDNSVDDDRAQRMNAADPTAAQALNIKLLEKPDPAADQNGIEDGEGDRTRWRSPQTQRAPQRSPPRAESRSACDGWKSTAERGQGAWKIASVYFCRANGMKPS